MFKIEKTDFCCKNFDCKMADRQQYKEIMSVYDYASILLTFKDDYYYIIHSGCGCYQRQMSSNVFIIIMENNEYTFEKPLQNIPLAG
jgi:hypothetical protein